MHIGLTVKEVIQELGVSSDSTTAIDQSETTYKTVICNINNITTVLVHLCTLYI